LSEGKRRARQAPNLREGRSLNPPAAEGTCSRPTDFRRSPCATSRARPRAPIPASVETYFKGNQGRACCWKSYRRPCGPMKPQKKKRSPNCSPGRNTGACGGPCRDRLEAIRVPPPYGCFPAFSGPGRIGPGRGGRFQRGLRAVMSAKATECSRAKINRPRRFDDTRPRLHRTRSMNSLPAFYSAQGTSSWPQSLLLGCAVLHGW